VKPSIVCNSGPLIAIGILDRFDLLRNLYGRVIVPAAVRLEVLTGGQTSAGMESFQRADWIEIHSNRFLQGAVLEALLDRGEASAIRKKRAQGACL
jgi:predicted nucleic acid-binding protein